MNTNWTLRRAVSSDSMTIANHACYRPEDASLRQPYADWVRVRIDSEQYVGMLAVSDGEVVGGAGVVLLDWGPTRANPGGVMGRLVAVYTSCAFRRQGVARAFVKSLLDRCEQLGVREFNLGATTEGKGLYLELGFVSYPAEMRRRVPL